MVNAVPAQNMYFKMFADDSGNIDMIVDGSVTPVSFRIGVEDRRIIQVARVVFLVQSQSFNENGWMESNTPLTNGIELRVLNTDTGRVLVSYNQENKLRANIDWGFIAGDELWTSGDFSGTKETAFVVWELDATGARLVLDSNEVLEVLVSDDLIANNRLLRAQAHGLVLE